MAAEGLSEAILRDLVRTVSLHRRGGGALDALPARQRELLQAMDEAQRRFFMEELAEADAEEGRGPLPGGAGPVAPPAAARCCRPRP